MLGAQQSLCPLPQCPGATVHFRSEPLHPSKAVSQVQAEQAVMPQVQASLGGGQLGGQFSPGTGQEALGLGEIPQKEGQ